MLWAVIYMLVAHSHKASSLQPFLSAILSALMFYYHPFPGDFYVSLSLFLSLASAVVEHQILSSFSTASFQGLLLHLVAFDCLIR